MKRTETIGDATLYLGDCLENMPTLEAVDCVIADPPYGCGKAEWDDDFPSLWYSEARRIGKMIGIITGSSGLKDSIPLVGDDFIDVISARNLNGMTRSPLGFGNWLACVIAISKPQPMQTFFEFVVNGDMPDHPSPKPLVYMLKLIERITDPCKTILDPFMGSGTTGVAALRLGRRFIGIEIKEEYFDIACKRIEQENRQLKMF